MPGAVAFLFPGQGAQAAGMGQALAEAFPVARDTFAEADAALGFPLSRLCFEGPEETLRLTEHTQPAILTVSVAATRAFRAAGGPAPAYVAGHSLGEYSALVAAGSLEFADAVRTVRNRGRYMQEAVPVGEGAMAAIIGLDRDGVAAACEEAAQGQVVVPANLNAAQQIVIAGHAPAVERAMAAGKARGARLAKRLPVSAPFHSPLMQPAQDRLAPELQALAFADPDPPLVNNVAAEVITTGDAARAGLIRQVSAPVRWVEVCDRLIGAGVTTVVELGPGNVLTGLLKRRRDADPRLWNVQDPASLDACLKGVTA